MAGSDETTIDLGAVRFEATERKLAALGGIEVSSFRYPSGVEALRVRNGAGEMVVMPFHGQQIWDATFHGRRLTMQSAFDEPVATDIFLHNYGCFLLHCGVTGMGNPGPGDTHPVHGELPNARLQSASLVLGRRDGVAFVRICGSLDYRVGFTANYRFSPSLTLAEGSGRIGLDVSIVNNRARPMELMYLAHINFRPMDGARIIDAGRDEPAHFRVRTHLPGFAAASAEDRALVERIAAEPVLHREVSPNRRYGYELVAGMDPVAGADGWAHALQLLPDGSADFVSYRPSELPHPVRWTIRNGDEDALGLVLPATAEADGLARERAKGHVQLLPPGAEFRASMSFGALTAEEARHVAAEIERARG